MSENCIGRREIAASEADAPSRRTLLGAATGGALFALAATAARAEDQPAGQEMHHDKMDHGSMDHSKMSTGPAPHQKLIDAALHCINTGEVCTNHCIALLGAGDTGLKDCIKTVQAMMATCAALTRLAALESPRTKEIAKLTLDVCSDCEAECKKHAGHHAQCKACAESCAACIKECKATIGA